MIFSQQLTLKLRCCVRLSSVCRL